MFDVTEAEVDKMIHDLNECNRWDKREVDSLSKLWIHTIMKQPYKENKEVRRPFEYSKKKIEQYLDWRKENSISQKIAYHLASDGTELNKKTKSPGAFYWYGCDNEGSPILWYRSSLNKYDGLKVEDELEFDAICIQAGIDAMPPHIHTFNVVVCFDEFNPIKALKYPSLVPGFIKLFMKICPDRLKRGILLTGKLGVMFYKIAKQIAPSNIMDKVTPTKNREETGKILLEEMITKETELPSFFPGGYAVHDEKITKNLPKMIESLKNAMWFKSKHI